MARYIDADRLVKNIAAIGDMRKLSTKTVGIAIDDTPTVDVVEVKHGRWKKIHVTLLGKIELYNLECSECGTVGEGNYCHNCGAKMDRKDEEDAKK